MNPLANVNNRPAFNRLVELHLPPWGGELGLRHFAKPLDLNERTRQLLERDRPDVWHSAFLAVLPREPFEAYVKEWGISPRDQWPKPDNWFTAIPLSKAHVLFFPDGRSGDWSVVARNAFANLRVVRFNADNYAGVTSEARCCQAPLGVCTPVLCPGYCTPEIFDYAEGDGQRLICECHHN